MNIVSYQPWSLLKEIQHEMNNIINRNMEKTSNEPANLMESYWNFHVDIKDEENRYVIFADLPGVEPKDIKISFENGILNIEGEKKSETNQQDKDYKRIERYSGYFCRRFSIPHETIDNENISAKSKHGVLQITLPKAKKATAKKINVVAEE